MITVHLLASTLNPDLLAASIAKICYDGERSAEDQMRQISQQSVERTIRGLIKSGHLSPLEHVSFTFEISGISRACSHQLVRHRIASYTQQSQRYTDQRDQEVIVPPTILNDKDFDKVLYDAVHDARKAYNDLIELGVPKEDARYILPEGCSTRIVVTMNARELLHFFELRCCERAQWEIRAVANKMLELAKSKAPSIFFDAGPSCISHGRCNEMHPCNKFERIDD